MNKLVRRLASIVLALCAALAAAGVAAAQGAGPYTVRDIAVSETAASAREAQTKGIATAKYAAAQRLLERLTLPEDRAAAASPVELSDLARIANTYDIQDQEKLSATSYSAVLSIPFNAAAVRQYLEARRVAYVDSQAGLALIAPAVDGRVDLAAWAAVWKDASDATLLTPYAGSQLAWNRMPAWADVEAEAAQRGAQRVIVAQAFPASGGFSARVMELRPGAEPAQIAVVGPFSNPTAARTAVLEALETAWKKATVVRTSGATPMSLTAAFPDLPGWVRIRRGLEQSRLIRELKIESLSAKGADVSFVYSGRPDQLAADLMVRGVALRGTDDGWVVEPAGVQ